MYLLMYHYVTLSRLMPRISAKLPGVPWEAYGSSAGLSSSGRWAAGWIGRSVDRSQWIHWGESDLGSATPGSPGWGILFESVCLCHAQNAPNAQMFYIFLYCFVQSSPFPAFLWFFLRCDHDPSRKWTCSTAVATPLPKVRSQYKHRSFKEF